MNARLGALFVSLIASGSVAQDFKRTVADTTSENEVCVTWSKRKLVYVVDAAGSARTPAETEFSAITSAWSTWQVLSDDCSDFTFSGGPRQANLTVGKGTQDSNALVFRESVCPADDPCHDTRTCANTLHCWDHDGDGVIALTTVTYSIKTGIIYDADIEYNAGSFLFTTVASPPCAKGSEMPTCAAYDVQNTTTHEIGHVVGFDHVYNVNSTMAPTADVGDTQKRIIDVGTQDGFCSTYPRAQAPVPCDQLAQIQKRIIARNTGTFGCSCDEAGGAAALWQLALGLTLLVARRSRS